MDALARLREGNERYVRADTRLRITDSDRRFVAEAQQPFAVVLGCSDSRVPTELVFDQGVGDLFVIRVAGNIVQPSQIGSVEFAAQKFGSRLVVILGHSRCGAIEAALDALVAPDEARSRNIGSIVSRIEPIVEPLLDSEPDRDALLQKAVRANVRSSAETLRHGSGIIEELVDTQGLVIVGAEYSLDTGIVDFFDGVP
jgi:carbonic anhydrase